METERSDRLSGLSTRLPSARSRRMVVIGALALAAGLFAIAAIVFSNNPGNNGLPAAIQSVSPGSGDNVLSQVEIVVDLAAGWDAELIVNGVAIPREQLGVMEGLNLLSFRPGEDKAVEALRPEQNCMQASYWRIAEGPGNPSIYSWCFFTS